VTTETLRRVDELRDKDRVFLDLTDKQQELFDLVMSGKFRRILFGGAVGGAKTVGVLAVLYALCRIFPGSRWAVIRKDYPVLKRNTLPSFWQTCPRPFFHPSKFNKLDFVATAANGSQILFLSENIKSDPDLLNLDGLEVNGAVLEQGEELDKKTLLKMIDRVGRWRLPIMPPSFILITCNPHQGYLKELFYTPWETNSLKPPYRFIQALPSDNPHLTEDYIESLEELKVLAPNLYKKRVQGSWEAEDDIQQLIGWDSLWKCESKIKFPKPPKTEKEKKEYKELYRSLGIDVGRFGKDPSVWYVFEGNLHYGFNVIYKERVEKTSGPQVEQITKRIIKKFEIPHHRTWMDIVGLGAFALDHLHQDGYEIQSFVGGSAPKEQFVQGGFLFKSLNCQVAWNVKILIEDGMIGNIDNDRLRGDLAAYGYDIKGEKVIEVWSKDVIKKKIKRSPDDGDSFKYGVWGAIYDTIVPLPGFEVI